MSRTPIARSSQYLAAPCCESASRSTELELAPARARAGGPISEQSASGSSHPDARPSVQPGRRRTPPPPVVQRLRERPAYFACSRHGRQTAGLRRHRPILFPALPPCLPGPPPRAGLRRLVWLVRPTALGPARDPAHRDAASAARADVAWWMRAVLQRPRLLLRAVAPLPYGGGGPRQSRVFRVAVPRLAPSPPGCGAHLD